MATTTVLPAPSALHATRASTGAAGAAALSILGTMGAIALIAAGLLVVPIAAAIAFGPALLTLF